MTPQFDYTHRNHFRFGINGEPWGQRKAADDQWWVEYGRCQRSPLSFGDECVETARLIGQSQDDIWLCLSGGVDSEVAALSFIRAGVPFRAAINRYSGDANIHDISWAVIFCEKYGIPYEFFDMDVADFFESGEAYEIAEEFRVMHPIVLPHMKLMDRVPGYPVLGSGECYLRKRFPDDPASVWEMYEREQIAVWYRLLMGRNRPGCPGFFQYTPEMMLAFLLEPEIEALCTNKGHPGKMSTQSSKPQVYRKYFDLPDRPKYTGFEKVDREFMKKHRHALVELNPDNGTEEGLHLGSVVKTPYLALIDQLSVSSIAFSIGDKA